MIKPTIPKIYTEIVQNNTSIFMDLTQKKDLYFEEKYLLTISGFSKKQLDLYLFRHKEIPIFKHEKKKYIGISIIEYIIKSLKK